MTWRVEGMFCPHCEQTILGALSGLPGLSNMRVSYRASTLSADWDRALLSEKQLADILANHGYTLKAPRSPLRDALGFAGGVATGSFFLKKGFSLGRAYEAKPLSGAVLPVLLVALLVIGTATGVYAMSTEGPGSKHAPVILSLVAALIIGALAQKSRMCFAGSIRDVILMKNFDLLSIIAALFAVMAVYNLAAGNFHLGFSGQPIAHSQHLWNILGMYVVGFAAVLVGGCPLRQLILAGQGSSDSAVTFLGMLLGAAAAHNFGLAGAAAKAATETEAAVPGGPSAAGKIAVIVCIVVLFVIAGTNLRRKKAAR